MSVSDLESLAVKVAIKTDEILKSYKINEADALSRRAKELPSLIQQAGLFQSIAFYLSKIENENLYKKIYGLLSSQQQSLQQTVDENEKKLLEEEVSGEGRGYTFLLAVLTYAIYEYSKRIPGLKDCHDMGGISNVARCMLELREKGLLLMVERALIPYLITVKRLFEALY